MSVLRCRIYVARIYAHYTPFHAYIVKHRSLDFPCQSTIKHMRLAEDWHLFDLATRLEDECAKLM